jgi:ATP-binding cassette subfamily B protein
VLPTPYRHLLGTYLLPHWRRAFTLALLLASLIGLDLVQPQIVRYVIDTAQAGGALGTLSMAAALYVGLALLVQAVGLAEQYIAESLGWLATNALRADLIRHCLDLDLAFHNAHTPGELIERLDGDVTVLANFFSRFVLQLIGNGLLLLGILLLLWRVEWRIGLTMLLFSLGALLIMHLLRKPGARYAQASRQAAADLFGFIEECLSGLADLQTAGAHSYVLRRLARALQATTHWGLLSFLMGSLVGDSMSMVFGVASAIALALGASFFRSGAISLGTVYLIFQYTTMVREPLDEITRQTRDFQRAGASVVRVWQLYTTPRTVVDGPGVALPPGALSVECRGVSFAYPPVRVGDEAPEAVLHDVSFRLAPGQVLGVLGRTGSGKTTLARLMCRLYDPGSGTVLLGGADLRAFRLDDLGRRVALVTQDVQLFAATVRDNLTLFDLSIVEERIVAALDGLGLSAWCRALPAGLDTVLAPGGTGLSAGEAQLLAFARVFLHDPDVVILDEASSRLDPATEQLVEQAVDRLLAGRTAIMIAHRLSTVARADEIMILEGGRIVETGARAALALDPTSRFAALLRTAAEACV